MNRTWWKLGIAGLWLGLPLLALRFWMVWDRLPAILATHFNAANQPNGWMTREGSLYFILGLYLFVVTLFTAILTVLRRLSTQQVPGWALLGLFYLILGVVFYGNESVLAYNLTGAPVRILPLVAPVLIAVVVVIILKFNRRGKRLPESATRSS